MPDKPLESVGNVSATRTARDAGLVGCRRCAKVWPMETGHCGRCGARLTSRDRRSLALVWFWWLLGILAYIPANTWPMLETRLFLQRSDDTIVEGAIKLIGHGSIGVAAIILLASVAIPLAKFAAIAWLAYAVQFRRPSPPKWRHRVYEAVEFIGRWSMVDVFVVAILSSLVQFSVLASVKPGPASLAFAVSVICTMLAALSFDSRMIWDLDDTASAGQGDDLSAVEKPAPAKR